MNRKYWANVIFYWIELNRSFQFDSLLSCAMLNWDKIMSPLRNYRAQNISFCNTVILNGKICFPFEEAFFQTLRRRRRQRRWRRRGMRETKDRHRHKGNKWNEHKISDFISRAEKYTRIPNYGGKKRELYQTRPYYVQHSNNMELNGFRAEHKLTMNIYFAMPSCASTSMSRWKKYQDFSQRTLAHPNR